MTEDNTKLFKELQDNWDGIRSPVNDNDPTVFNKPRSGCKHCYGQGFKGALVRDGVAYAPAICQCMTNSFTIRKQMPDTNNGLTHGQFRALLAKAKEVYNIKEPEDEHSNETVVESV